MKTLHEDRVRFTGEDGNILDVSYDNRGDPYRKGVSLWLTGERVHAGCFLEQDEARKLADLIDTLYPKPIPRVKVKP